MKFKNFIFDLDGTILDSKNETIEAFNLFAKELIGRNLTEEEVVLACHKPSRDTMLAIGIEATEENVLNLNKKFEDLAVRTKIFEGLKEVMTNIKKRASFLGLATNRNSDETRHALEHKGLYEFFSDYICRDDAKKPKPSGEMLINYMKRHDLKAEDTIFIGNAITDHLAAIDAGIAYGACRWGTTHYLEEESIIINRPLDLLELL